MNGQQEFKGRANRIIESERGQIVLLVGGGDDYWGGGELRKEGRTSHCVTKKSMMLNKILALFLKYLLHPRLFSQINSSPALLMDLIKDDSSPLYVEYFSVIEL